LRLTGLVARILTFSQGIMAWTQSEMLKKAVRMAFGRVLRRSLGVIGFLAVVLVTAPSGSAGATGPLLQGEGSYLAANAINEWSAQFYEQDGGQVVFSPESNTFGLNGFTEDVADFGASDLTYGSAGAIVPGVPYQYVPDVGYPLTFEYNLLDRHGQRISNLVLNGSTIAGIFTGHIASWDDPAIAKLNPSVKLPHETITPFYRTDASGENDLLSAYTLQTDPKLVTDFQSYAGVPTPAGEPSATWASFSQGAPPNTKKFPDLSSLVGENGANAASQAPVNTVGGIAYVPYPYSIVAGLPLASVVNESGHVVEPTVDNAALALKKATLNSDLSADLKGVFKDRAAKAYPVSGYSYLVVACSPTLAAAEAPATSCSGDNTGSSSYPSYKGSELGQFIDLAVCQGQADIAPVGYAPLPANLVEDAFQAVGRIPGATEPPAPTYANCPNPELNSK
jgi:phosphate transport system substrate-binding protein